jgi:hypothetical protein
MAHKRIATLANGRVVNISVARENAVLAPGQVDVTGLGVGPGWLYDGSVWAPPTQDTSEAEIAPKTLLRALTPDEIDGIVASTDAAVRVILERLRTYRELELLVPVSKVGGLLNLLVSKGLLTAARRTELVAKLGGG